jgi:hypothetical protein
VAQASPISAVEGNDTGSLTVASFTTPDMNSQAGDFTASVNWGDGNSDMGTVAGQNGSFTVTDDHTYAEKGSYPVSVTITDNVTGASTTVATTATVSDAALTLTGGLQLGAVAGQSSNLTLATLTDANPSAGEDYSATINWGDGSPTTQATVTYGADGGVSIGGSYAYAQKGSYIVTLSVQDVDGATATATSTIVVGDVYAGIQSNLTVASFQDSNTSVQASQFTATITWGDGTQSNGTVSGSNGTFTVQGTHTYVVDSIDQPGGIYPATVTISDPSGNTLTSNGMVRVVRPPMAAEGDNVHGQPGAALNNVQVAEFTVPDATDGQSEFSATINWGDGNSSGGTIQEVSPGLFEVLGSHTYAAAGDYTIQAAVSQEWIYPWPIILTLSTAAVGAAPPSLRFSGLQSAANAVGRNRTYWAVGNSMTTITANYNTYTKTDPPPTVTITGDGEAFFWGWTGSNYSRPKSWSGLLYIGNRSGTITVTVKFANAQAIEENINVIQVEVTNPPGGATLPTVAPFDMLNQVKNPARKPFKVVASAGEGQAGFAWGAKVTWQAPQTLPKNLYLELGFVQHVYVEQYQGIYANGRSASQMQGGTYLDVGMAEKLKGKIANGLLWVVPSKVYKFPFYSFISEGTKLANPLPGGVLKQQYLLQAGESCGVEVIGAYDTPAVMVPWTNDAGQYAQGIAFKWVFKLDVVADLTMQPRLLLPAPGVQYWPQATMNWVFEGNLALSKNNTDKLPLVGLIPETLVRPLSQGWLNPTPPKYGLLLGLLAPQLTFPYAVSEKLSLEYLDKNQNPTAIANYIYAQGVFQPKK